MLRQEALSAQTATSRAVQATSMKWPCKQRPLTRRYIFTSVSCVMAMACGVLPLCMM